MKCPQCNKEIPDYRSDDPFCECGWQKTQSVEESDEISWLFLILSIVIVCFAQILVLYIVHTVSGFSLNLLNNLLYQYLGFSLVSLMHYFIILSIDLLVLGVIYVSVVWFLAKKSSSPILMAGIFAFVVLSFKFLVIDPRSIIAYHLLGYIQNIVLFVITIGTGILIDHMRKSTAEGG